MKKNIIKIALLSLLLALPFISEAQTSSSCTPYTLKCVAVLVTEYLTIGIKLIISFAIVTFIWNVYRYFFTEKDKKEAGMYVLYSTIGFFVILSFWGLVALLGNSLNLPNSRPSWPFNGSSSNNSSLNPGNVIPSASTP
jgi:uncharacterized protein YacL